MPALSPNLRVMQQAIQKASRRLVRDFGEIEYLQVSKKGPGDFVTVADTRTEKILIEELRRARPDYCFLTEESGEIGDPSSAFRWIIDPIDGTKNFMHAVPYFCISVALEHTPKGRDSEIIAGAVYDPIADEMFWAEKGKGAFLNDRRLRVSARNDFEQSLMATGLPYYSRKTYDYGLRSLQTVGQKVSGLRCPGAAALDLAYVAAGRYEACWFPELHAWDMAAAILLVREANGRVTDIKGNREVLPTGSILASNGQVHDDMLRLLAEAGELNAA